jgi:hypothetical protein
MYAIYYECVNGKKKFKQIYHGSNLQPCVYQSAALPSSPSHSLSPVKLIFILKVNHAQFKQTTPECGRQEENLGLLDTQPSTLPLEPFSPCPFREIVKYLN